MTPAERRRIKAALDGLEARVRALAARLDAADQTHQPGAFDHDGPFAMEDAMVAGIDARNERQRARRQSVADLYARDDALTSEPRPRWTRETGAVTPAGLRLSRPGYLTR